MANINQIQLPDGSNYNLKDSVSGYASETYVDNAVAAIDKASVGLGNVDNTSDLNKPVSTAQQTALNAKANNSTIAPVEASTTASRRYEIGDQFILSGVLYTATAIIANSGTITVGTNCTASDTIVEQIANVSPSADNVSFDNTGTDLVSENVENAIKEVNAKTQHGIVELWTNPSPTSNFAGQTLTISQSDLDTRGLAVDINDIDAIDVEFEVSGITIATLRGRIGGQMQPSYISINGTGKILWFLRACEITRATNAISIEFRDCFSYTLNSYGTAPTTGTTNNYLVPTIITGLIHND